jgi:hypothetical protein
LALDPSLEFAWASSAKSAPPCDQRRGLLLGFDEDVAGIDLFRRLGRLDLGIVACAHIGVLDATQHLVLEIGVVQGPVTKEGHALLERLAVCETRSICPCGQKLDVEQRRKGCHPTLLHGQLSELRIEIRQREGQFGFVNFDIADRGDDPVFTGGCRIGTGFGGRRALHLCRICGRTFRLREGSAWPGHRCAIQSSGDQK